MADKPITKELIDALVVAVGCMDAAVITLEKEPQFQAENAVGSILRERNERVLHSRDIIAGWVKRRAPEAHVYPENLGI